MLKIFAVLAALSALPSAAVAQPPAQNNGGFLGGLFSGGGLFGGGDGRSGNGHWGNGNGGDRGHGTGGGWSDGGGERSGGGPHRGAPAPLLAAGIPAFIALGGAAGLGRLVRRRRDKAHGPTQTMHGTSTEV